jgi:hypothetical protein
MPFLVAANSNLWFAHPAGSFPPNRQQALWLGKVDGTEQA